MQFYPLDDCYIVSHWVTTKWQLQANNDLVTIVEIIMNSLVSFTIKEKTEAQVNRLTHIMGKQKQAVLRELVEIGLKSYKAIPTESAQAVLDLIEWAEKEKITSKAKDLSTNHNTYAWDE